MDIFLKRENYFINLSLEAYILFTHLNFHFQAIVKSKLYLKVKKGYNVGADGTFVKSRVTRLGNFLPIWLLLEALNHFFEKMK
jgi:hypothetical protein